MLLRGHFASKRSVPHEAETRRRIKVHFVEKYQEGSEADCASLGLASRNRNAKKTFYSAEIFAMFEFSFC